MSHSDHGKETGQNPGSSLLLKRIQRFGKALKHVGYGILLVTVVHVVLPPSMEWLIEDSLPRLIELLW